MTTVAMPVFSKKKETLSHGILLGVVGTDIPLVEVMMLAPRYKVQQEIHLVAGSINSPVTIVVLMQCVSYSWVLTATLSSSQTTATFWHTLI